MKNTIKGLNIRLDEAERINELEDRAMELTQAGQQKEKKEWERVKGLMKHQMRKTFAL